MARGLPALDLAGSAHLAEGTWLTVLTTGARHEDQRGQCVTCALNSDQWSTWSAPLQIGAARRAAGDVRFPRCVEGGQEFVKLLARRIRDTAPVQPGS